MKDRGAAEDILKIYLNEDHRIDYHNRRRRKTPTRPYHK